MGNDQPSFDNAIQGWKGASGPQPSGGGAAAGAGATLVAVAMGIWLGLNHEKVFGDFFKLQNGKPQTVAPLVDVDRAITDENGDAMMFVAIRNGECVFMGRDLKVLPDNYEISAKGFHSLDLEADHAVQVTHSITTYSSLDGLVPEEHVEANNAPVNNIPMVLAEEDYGDDRFDVIKCTAAPGEPPAIGRAIIIKPQI